MMKFVFIIFLLFPIILLNAFEIIGDTKSWDMEDFIGFDTVGDCFSQTGDITSAFARIEDGKLYFRLTFNDMAEKRKNKMFRDNFLKKDLKMKLQISDNNSKEILYTNTFLLNLLEQRNSDIYLLRNPQYNLLELSFDWLYKIKKDDLFFEIEILENNILIDTYYSFGARGMRGGNCAFAHHGNQGLTYTEVFYGQYPIETSGFDEVLEAHQTLELPGNFHLSGTLMPAAAWHNPEFNDWLAEGVVDGYVAMLSSALGQHIMPFLQNDMNNWSVSIETDMVNFLYNYEAKVSWIPERVWLAPGIYPEAGVIDWIGDNWVQHGIDAVILDDFPHCSGASNTKIHWMNNGSGIDLRVIPINNSFVGDVHYNPDAAKDQIAGTGQYGIVVYGTDWEVAAEMNEHHDTFFLDNYENVLGYCHDNYPAVNVWKLDAALNNSDFNGSEIDITPGTYGLLGGGDGYGGSNNSWYTSWASTGSHSDYHDPMWNYGYIWSDVYNNLMTAPNNSLAQLGWYTLMINLHETGWHTSGEVADWEHRYSSHIKNANVFAEASRWANGDYTETTAAYFNDIDHDGGAELIMHNDKVLFVFEGIGGKANWVFYKDSLGNQYSVVGSDVAYWSETDGDYNESSNNHLAALSDVSPNQQHAIYDITITARSRNTVEATLTQWGVSKTISLTTGNNYLDVVYNFYDQTGYVKSGWTPGLLDLIWSGKSHLQRMWGDYASYCGYRNSSSGATIALVLGNGGASHNYEFEGTLVKGDEISGYKHFKTRLFAGYTSEPSGTQVAELDTLASENLDIFPPELNGNAFLVSDNITQLNYDESVDQTTAENTSNYSFQNFSSSYTISSITRQTDWRKVNITINETFQEGDAGQIVVSNVQDLNGNVIDAASTANLSVPSGFTPHTINIDGSNDFDETTELIDYQTDSLYITWNSNNLYIGYCEMDLGSEGDLFVNIDTDQADSSGATSGSWGRVDFSNPYLPEYQVAIEGGGGSMQVNNWTAARGWNYPGTGTIGSSYEGWSGNGFTEISIPWSALGNPTGIALSVHVTEEDNNIVTEVFPEANSTGDHPEFNFVYAYFTPYINDDMPLSGMQPNTVFVVPNSSPQINVHFPDSLDYMLEENSSQEFSVSASDSDGDVIDYNWKLDGVPIRGDSVYNYVTDYNSQGLHSLEITVTDNVPENEPDTLIWSVTVIDNVSPEIISYDPDSLNIIKEENSNQEFSVSVIDVNGDSISYYWELDGTPVRADSIFNYFTDYESQGLHTLLITVRDSIPGNVPDSLTWSVTVIDNVSPEIISYDPDSLNITMEENSSQEFSVSVIDINGDSISYYWELDGNPVRADSIFNYVTDYNSQGLHTLLITVTDSIPGNVPDSLTWSITVKDNVSPEIISYDPDSLNITMEENSGREFSVSVIDVNGDSISYYWELDGNPVRTDSIFNYVTDYNSQGLHTLLVTVTDSIPGNVPDSLTWSITVNDFVLGVPDVTITIVGNNVQLDWAEVPGATSYRIEWAENPYGDFNFSDTSTVNIYTHIDGALGNKKYYRVIAIVE